MDDNDERPQRDELLVWSVSSPAVMTGPDGKQTNGRIIYSWHFNDPTRIVTDFIPDRSDNEPTTTDE